MRIRALALIGLTFLIGCSSDTSAPPSSATPSKNLPVQVVPANYEVVVNQPTRFLFGLLLNDGRVVEQGTVQVRFAPLDDQGQPSGTTSEIVNAGFLPLEGDQGSSVAEDPVATTPEGAPGVYEMPGATFNQAGTWAVEVAARVQEYGVVQGSATLEVVGKATVPTLGDRAPRSDNYTLSTPGIRAEAIDSRAIDGATVPDRSLHRSTIAGGIAARKPTVVLFSTPTFCVSRFCGPVTNMVEALSSDFADRATFVHVEVWKDFSKSIVNPTAQEWLWQGDGLNEPWLFVIGADGRVCWRAGTTS